MFYNAHQALNITLGTVNTVVLITSSLTMALSIRGIQLGQKKQTILFLVTTLVLALTFLVIKYFEYMEHIHLGELPGKYYSAHSMPGTNPHIFWSVYYTMTGLHGIHVIAGISAIGWMLYRTLQDHFSREYFNPLEMTGLYWHLVDIIWIFLFPLLYLIG